VYYTEAVQETIYTTREDMLVSNYVKQKARGQRTTLEEKEAYQRVVAALGHSDQCYCETCCHR
jgi:hypothetical protein